MTPYYLFFPAGKGKASAKDAKQQFADAGFDPAWLASWATPGPISGVGPSGGRGTVYAPRGTAGYFPDRQHWEKREGYWLGWATKDGQQLRPTPDALVRHDNHGGVPTKLADGQEWLVPVPEYLPHGHVFDGKAWERKIKAPFQAYWDQTLTFYGVWKAAFGGEEKAALQIDWTAGASFACTALGFNYYLTPSLVSDFDLLDDMAIQRIQLAAMQAKLIEEVTQKKRTTRAT